MNYPQWSMLWLKVCAACFIIFSAVQLFKGKTWLYAIEFGALWSVITAGVYIGARIYYARRAIDCAKCKE